MASFSSTNSVPWQRCGAMHVAVYGTLRAGGVNDIARLHPGIQRTGVTALTGTLHDLGWYPGLSLQGEQSVLAEVYPLDDALEQVMDGIEGIWPRDVGEYAKRIVATDVQLPDGGSRRIDVLVYEAQPSFVRGTPVIDASDWLAWYEAQGKPHSDQPFALRTESSAAPSAD
ncbi:gamma-glutamylcyclotransferase [Diaphorobacter sp. HDW4A]|nr:gamma-glutamylcyclotransferase [Diaphorobacter sp. HDW4A]